MGIGRIFWQSEFLIVIIISCLLYALPTYVCSSSSSLPFSVSFTQLRFMSGELQLNNAASAPISAAASSTYVAPIAAPAPAMAQMPYAPAVAMAPAPVAVTVTPTRVVELKQMLTQQDLEDDEEYNDILEDTRDECASFGSLKNIVIPRSGPGATKIFLEYLSVEDAGKAIAGLKGRTFDGRQVEAAYFDELKFANEDYSD